MQDVLAVVEEGRSPVVLNDRREQVEGFAEALKEKVRYVVLLDTLFLASPISWKGRLTQFAGRLHRLHDGKREVRIYDYVDVNVAVCARMYDLLDAMHKLAVMLDVSAELSDLDAYRRARREDWLLQKNGYRGVRLLVEDVCTCLDKTLTIFECGVV